MKVKRLKSVILLAFVMAWQPALAEIQDKQQPINTSAGQPANSKTTTAISTVAKSSKPRITILKATECFDFADPRLANANFLDDDLDIFAIASHNLLLSMARSWPPPKGNLVAGAELYGALTNYDLGNIPQGDRLLELAEASYIKGQSLPEIPDYLPQNIVTTLCRVDHVKNADRFLQMYFGSENGLAAANPFQNECRKILINYQVKSDPAAAKANAKIVWMSEPDMTLWYADVLKELGETEEARKLRKKSREVLSTLAPNFTPQPDANKFSQPVRERAETHLTFYENRFPLLLAAYCAIAKDDKKLAETSNKLLFHSVRNSAEKQAHSPTLFCSILSIARGYSDKGWIDLSNNVLDELQAVTTDHPAGEFLLTFEQLENRIRQGKNTDVLWARLKSQYHLTMASADHSTAQIADYAWSERLRRLAMIYMYAGEVSRAETIIKKALSESSQNPPEGVQVLTNDEGKEGESVMLLLDAACIAAKQGHAGVAQDFLSKATSHKALSSHAYGATLSQIAITFYDSGHTSEAITLLQKIRTLPVLQTEAEKSATAYLGEQPDLSRVSIDYTLARLLCERGNSKDAMLILEEAVALMRNRPSIEVLVLAADCAEKTGDFKAAAKYCKMAAETNEYGPMMFNTGQSFAPEYLKKAQTLEARAAN